MRRRYLDAATLVARKNLDGRLAARSAAGLPFLLCEGMRVWLVPPQVDAPREGVVESVAITGDGEATLAISTISDADAAEAVVGCHVLVDACDVEEAGIEVQAAVNDLFEGWRFLDSTSGMEGKVRSLDATGPQPLLEVVLDSAEGTHLVPFAEDLIDEIDEEGLTLAMSCPPGLFEI